MPLLRKGDRVADTLIPGWGKGIVLNEATAKELIIFFVWGGKKKYALEAEGLVLLSGIKANNPILDLIETDFLANNYLLNKHRYVHHNVYVIELHKQVLNERSFLNANQGRDPLKPCVYVGMTGLSPEQRFKNHKEGYRSSRFPHKYGQRLLSRLFRDFNPMPYELAKLIEPELAAHLRSKGYVVWQN